MGELFSQSFMPHGHCYLWKPEILWLNAISDGIIFLSYMAIPVILAYIVHKSHHKLPFNHLFILFSIFILTCGTTHFLEIVNIWKAEYFLAGLIKAVTAISSIATAFALVPFIPKIIEFIKAQNEE